MTIAKTLVAFAAAAVATVAMAEVTLHPDGTGFVGKGDVQLALGYNNKQLQDNASSLIFQYQEKTKYRGFCVTEDKQGELKEKNVVENANINSMVAYDARTNKQITGFNLLGFTGKIKDGEPMVDGEACKGAGNADGTMEGVVVESKTQQLTVNSVPLPLVP